MEYRILVVEGDIDRAIGKIGNAGMKVGNREETLEK